MITKLNYCLLFHYYYHFSVLIPANRLTYQKCWFVMINLLSVLIMTYLISLNLMKFQVCYKFISFFILKTVIECPEEIFKKLWSVLSSYMIILKNSFLKSQIYDKLVPMLLSYHLPVTRWIFNFCWCKPFSITKIHASWKFQFP